VIEEPTIGEVLTDVQGAVTPTIPSTAKWDVTSQRWMTLAYLEAVAFSSLLVRTKVRTDKTANGT
jgi:hypothetical protein